jgi:Iron-dependent Transcriptional regulator
MHVIEPTFRGVPQRCRRKAMHLTLWTDYALRTLIYVGAKGEQLSTIAEIAESFDISKSHLMKVVNKLGQQAISTPFAERVVASGCVGRRRRFASGR